MSDTLRTLFIALGIALLVGGLLPILFMVGMMGMMSAMMSGMMSGVMSSGPWLMIALLLLVLGTGMAFLMVGLKR